MVWITESLSGKDALEYVIEVVDKFIGYKGTRYYLYYGKPVFERMCKVLQIRLRRLEGVVWERV